MWYASLTKPEVNIKQLLDKVILISGIIKVEVTRHTLFWRESNKQPAHETQTDIENHAFRAQPSNKSIISKQITNEPLVTVTMNIVLQTLVTVFLSGVFVGEIHESKNYFVFVS